MRVSASKNGKAAVVDRPKTIPPLARQNFDTVVGRGPVTGKSIRKTSNKAPDPNTPRPRGGTVRCISYSNLSARRTYVRPVGRHVCYTNSTPLTRAPRQFPYRFRCFTLNNRPVPARAVFIVFVHTPRTCRPTISPIARFSNGKALDERWPRFL